MKRAAALALGVALVVAVFAAQRARAAAARPVAAPPASAGARTDAPLPTVPGAAKPNVAVLDLEGIRQAMRKSRGHVLLVHFWATWCAPCLEELPVIDKFAREMKGRGVDVLSLSLDDVDRSLGRVAEVLSQWAPSLTPSVAKIGDPDSFITSFDREWEGTIPALFAFDAQGSRRASLVGEATRRDLDRLVTGAQKPAPAAKKK